MLYRKSTMYAIAGAALVMASVEWVLLCGPTYHVEHRGDLNYITLEQMESQMVWVQWQAWVMGLQFLLAAAGLVIVFRTRRSPTDTFGVRVPRNESPPPVG